jgi:hypothetical protein
VHADDNIAVPTDADADKFGVIMKGWVRGASESNAVFIGVCLGVKVTRDRVGFLVMDFDDELNEAKLGLLGRGCVGRSLICLTLGGLEILGGGGDGSRCRSANLRFDAGELSLD